MSSLLAIHLSVLVVSLWIGYGDIKNKKVYHLPLFILFILGLASLRLALSDGMSFLVLTFITFILSTFFVKKIGGGDLKLIAVSGLFLSIQTLPLFFIFTGLLGVLFHLIYARHTGHQKMPFAPAILTGLNASLHAPTAHSLFPFVIP